MRQGPKCGASVREIISQPWGMGWGKRERSPHEEGEAVETSALLILLKSRRLLT